MSRLENLKEVADRNLGGLSADTRLLHQILRAQKPKPEKKIRWRPVLLTGAAVAVLAVVSVFALPQLMRYNNDIDVVTHSAGGDVITESFPLTANVPVGSVNISEPKAKAPAYRNLFAQAQGATFPLIKIGEKTYRMLVGSVSVAGSQLGESLGKVTEYTSEPAVSSGGVVSNVVQTDQTVYAVKNMKGAAAAAEVGGTLRVFQRVGFSGIAVTGGETLKDVLVGSATAVSLELSDVGRVDQADKVQALMDTLFRYAHYEGAAESANRSQSLLITLNNGVTVQMNAGNGTLSACGTWSCPEFFEAFGDALFE